MKRFVSNLKHGRWPAGAMLVAVAALVLPASARVFRLLGPERIPELNNGLHAWENACQTAMTVNGRPAVMRLYSVRWSEPVLEQLKGRFEALGAQVGLATARDGAVGIAVWPDREARFLVLSPPSQPRHLVFVFYPEPGAAAQPVEFPVPQYDRARIDFTASDEGIFLATLETPDRAADVHAFYAARLAAEGWEPVAPARLANGAAGGLAAYRKRNRVCFVQAAERPGGSGWITLLVKNGAL